MTDKSKGLLKSITGWLVTGLIAAVTILWGLNYDYVKRVDAKCEAMEQNKIGRDYMEYIDKRLDRIEVKLDDMDRRRK